MDKTVSEFRGCRGVVLAKVTRDDASMYTAGTVVPLCEVAQIAKKTSVNTQNSAYDNIIQVQIKDAGADEITLIVPAMYLEALAKVTGAYIDPSTGAYMSGGDDDSDYYALGYILDLTDGTSRYVWRLKGKFLSIPDETSDSKGDGIKTNNQTIVYSGVDTIHKWTIGDKLLPRRDVVIDERDGLCNLATFFNQVQTPANIYLLSVADVTALSLSPATLSIETGSTGNVSYSITPATRKPVLTSSNTAVATVDNTGRVTALRAGTAYIIATAGTLSASTTVTVADPQ